MRVRRFVRHPYGCRQLNRESRIMPPLPLVPSPIVPPIPTDSKLPSVVRFALIWGEWSSDGESPDSQVLAVILGHLFSTGPKRVSTGPQRANCPRLRGQSEWLFEKLTRRKIAEKTLRYGSVRLNGKESCFLRGRTEPLDFTHTVALPADRRLLHGELAPSKPTGPHQRTALRQSLTSEDRRAAHRTRAN